jgi:hypothetical protein
MTWQRGKDNVPVKAVDILIAIGRTNAEAA